MSIELKVISVHRQPVRSYKQPQRLVTCLHLLFYCWISFQVSWTELDLLDCFLSKFGMKYLPMLTENLALVDTLMSF